MSRLKRFVLILIVVAISPIHLFAQATSSSKPIPIKVVVVAMFERGEDTGDTPGEYQLWVEREHLDQIIALPAGYHHVRLNKDGVLGILTGVGTASIFRKPTGSSPESAAVILPTFRWGQPFGPTTF